MAIWLIKHQADPPRYDVLDHSSGEYAFGIDVPKTDNVLWYWNAAKMVRANILRRFEDATPQFAARSDEPEAVAFAEMLNA